MSRRSPVLLVLAGLAAGAGGCTLSRLAEQDVAEALARYRQQQESLAQGYGTVRAATRPLRGGARPAGPEPNEATARPETAPAEPQSLRDYILLALSENPEIKAAEENARARAARVAQQTVPSDPVISTRTLPRPQMFADGSNYFNLGVDITLPVPEKLDRAGRVAWMEARMGVAELQRVRLNVIADVKRTYFRIYIIDRTIEVDLANQDLLRGLIDAARAQVAAGRRGQDDVLRAQVELSSLESELVGLRQERQTSAALLNSLLNRPPATAVPALPDFDLRSVDTRLEDLMRCAAEHSPELQRLQRQIERDRESLSLARLGYWPDFLVGFEWMYMRPRPAFEPLPDPATGLRPDVDRMSESGRDMYAIMAGFSLPIWSEKIEGAIREAQRRLLASQHEYSATRNRVHYAIEDALARVRAQQELAGIFRSTIIPQAQQAYEVSRAAYSAGTTDFLYVIDNWRRWLTFTTQYHRALGELERSVADLEQAVGLSLAESGGGS